MENWEIERRKQLSLTVNDKIYNHSNDSMTYYTGKRWADKFFNRIGKSCKRIW